MKSSTCELSEAKLSGVEPGEAKTNTKSGRKEVREEGKKKGNRKKRHEEMQRERKKTAKKAARKNVETRKWKTKREQCARRVSGSCCD